jgi:hypothetical protein
VASLVLCREIFEDRRRGDFALIGPFSGIGLSFFPAGFRFSLYAHLADGHGSYQLGLHLRDEEGTTVWQWQWPEPTQFDPLQPHRLALHDVVVEFPAPGRYDLVLRANGEDLAHHALWLSQKGKE